MRLPMQTLRTVTTTLAMVLILNIVNLALPATVYGQGRSQTKAPAPPPQQKDEMSPERMAQTMDMMAPMMGRVIQSMMEASLTYLARPEAAEKMATFTKNYYDALIAKGFSKEDALRIVMAHGIPATPAAK